MLRKTLLLRRLLSAFAGAAVVTEALNAIDASATLKCTDEELELVNKMQELIQGHTMDTAMHVFALSLAITAKSHPRKMSIERYLLCCAEAWNRTIVTRVTSKTLESQ